MSKGLIALIVIGCLLFVGLIGVVGVASMVKGKYNVATQKTVACDKAWGTVQAVYQRRYDLIPNLVKIVEGAANFEKSTLVQVTQARASVGQIKMVAGTTPGGAPTTESDLENFSARQQTLGTALSRLMVVMERYPELRATQQFADLSAQLEGTENRISVARMDYNEAIGSYNVFIRSWIIPMVSLKMFGWAERPMFQIQTPEAENAPAVNFDSLKPTAN